MWHFILYAALLLLSLGAVALNIISLPGNWIMLLLATLVSLLHGWHAPTPLALAGLAAFAAVGETIDVAGGMLGAKGFGASNASTWWAMFGGIVGAFIGLPVPLIGSILGAVLGSFIGALACELARERAVGDSLWAALGAALGRAAGLIAKLACGLGAWSLLAWTAWPH